MSFFTKFTRQPEDGFRISPRKLVIISTIYFGLMAGFAQTDFGKTIELKVARQFQFQARDALGLNPPVDKRLKMLMFDDDTLKFVGDTFNPDEGIKTDFNLNSWAQIYKYIAKHKVQIIFTDKLFSSPNEPIANRKKFIRDLKEINTPIVGASYQAEELEARLFNDRLIDLNKSEFEILNWTKENPAFLHHLYQPNFKIYGPHNTISDAFSLLGHIQLQEKGLQAPAFLNVDNQHIIPHWSMFIAKNREIRNDHLYLDNKKVSLTKEGNIFVNLLPRESFQSQTKPLYTVVKALLDKQDSDFLQPNDVVMILFNNTGISDWHSTYFGRMEGGYINAGIANSVLTGNWLYQVNDFGLILVLAIVLSAFMSAYRKPRFVLIALFSSLGLLPISGLVLFSFLGLEISWFYPTLSIVMVTGAISYDRFRVAEKRTMKIRNALSGLISEEKLEQIIHSPDGLDIKPSSREVTIMFIDMVGFSIVAERTQPEEAFALLKDTMQEITHIIHNFGGVIDRTLGDGVLCFFGYHYDGSEVLGNHTSQAIDCAIHIQREILRKNLAAHRNNKPNFPLRIGINTDHVFIGDMGDERRLDYTLIGDGVNFAQRLESSCESYQILVSESTYSRYDHIDIESVKAVEKWVRIKHHEKLIKTFEIDPFVNDPEELLQAIQAYQQFANLERQHERIPTIPENRLQITTPYDEGYLVDYSEASFGLWLPRYIGKGVDLELRLETNLDVTLYKTLRDEGLFPLFAQVRWSRSHEGGYVHGLALHNLSQSRQNRIFSLLSTAANPSKRRVS